MADKPPEDGYISVVDEEPVFLELLKWDTSQSHKQPDPMSLEKAKSPEQSVSKQREFSEPFDLSDAAFIETFRLPKHVARNLCEELRSVMPETTRACEFSVESKVMAALSFYASGKYQKSMCGRSDPSISQYFVAGAVIQVTEAMNHSSIVKKYIHFPHLRDEREMIKNGFYMKYNIPNVVGCVDCMHVPIAKPDDDQKKHFNKSYHSKKVQIICDSIMNIISVDATPGGSLSHDAILNQHAVKVDLESLNQSRELCWLVGSSYYSQKPYIMVPNPRVTKKTPESPDKYYMTVHSQAHSVVTDTIKQLKSRWKCLQATCNKQFDPNQVAMMVTACCILHNICNVYGLPPVQMTQTEERLEAMKQRVANTKVSRKQVEDPRGVESRNVLTERLWQERRVTSESSSARKRTRKDRILESQVHPPQQMPMHEDPKRHRLVMNNPYNLGVGMAPGWGHYPQH